jgi:hypothetical protein
MLEECLPDFFFRKARRKIDAEDFGAERARDATDLYCSTLMFAPLMIAP